MNTLSNETIAAGSPRGTLAATILGSSLAFIDGSVINVALPSLAADLGANGTGLTWTINAYLLPLGALILIGGALGDRYGRRRFFLVGLGLFTVATLACAVAPSLPVLLAGRGIQGLGAALLMPNSLAIIGSAFQAEERGRAIGTWAAVGALAGALGPIIGGWLIDAVGWRSIFYLNLPIAAAAFYLGGKYVAESRDVRIEASLDALGAFLATGFLALLTFALTEASDPAGRAGRSSTAAVSGVVLLAVFVAVEVRRGDRALIPITMFASQPFVGLTLLTFFLYGSLGGLIVALPFFLIRVEHWTALAAGAALLPVPLVIGLGSRFMGRIAARSGGRLPLAGGSVLVAAGLALYARIGGAPVQYWSDLLAPTLLVALGMGASVAPLTATVMSSVDGNHVGAASGFNSAVARIAGLIATALLGFLFARQSSNTQFVAALRMAAIIGSASAALAAVCALVLIRVPAKATR